MLSFLHNIFPLQLSVWNVCNRVSMQTVQAPVESKALWTNKASHTPSPCAGAAPGEKTGQSLLQQQPQQQLQPPSLSAMLDVKAEMKAMNERMTCLQSSVDNILWILSQSCLESIHQANGPQSHTPGANPFHRERQANQGCDQDFRETRHLPPKRTSAWAVTHKEMLGRSATIPGSAMLSSAGYNNNNGSNVPKIPKQVMHFALHVHAEHDRRELDSSFGRSKTFTHQ